MYAYREYLTIAALSAAAILLPASEIWGQLPQQEFAPGYPPEMREMLRKELEQSNAAPVESQDEEQDQQPSQPQQSGEENVAAGDPRELDARPDSDGYVRLQFQGQPWQQLIAWFGSISGVSVDWRELPTDRLNLRSTRRYTLDEVRDLLNRHLLARGFTMLADGESFFVEKLDGLDPALVPRIAPIELAQQMPHDFVKTSFPLRTLVAEKVVKALEPMKGKHGQVIALSEANRIEAIDVVKNLRAMYLLLENAQSSSDVGLREFVLKHVRATYVVDKLQELTRPPSQRNLPLLQQQVRQLQIQLQQQQQGQQRPQQQQQQPHGANLSAPTGDATVTFVVNQRRNSVIARAPADQMMVIENAIRLLDVPTEHGNSLDAHLVRMRTYRLATLDPQEVVNVLLDTGVMDPSTQLRVDKDSRAIIASATPWDHLTIEKLVNKLDGSARHFRVVRLRRRRADRVATTIEALMVGRDDEQQRRRYSYYSRYDESRDNDKFRVGADVKQNWLLLWCNDTEYKEVMDLLVELGEAASLVEANRSRQRVIEGIPRENQQEFLEKLRDAFRAVAPNPLELPAELAPDAEESTTSSTSLPSTHAGFTSTQRTRRSGDTASPTKSALFRFVQFGERRDASAAAASAAAASAAGPPPVRISLGPDGRLHLFSEDTSALNVLEDLIAEISASSNGYHVIELQHASPIWVAFKLEDFFEEEGEESRDRAPFFFNPPANQQPQGLGDRGRLRFISDGDTNTIVVRDATSEQLATIRDLVELYDIPEPVNAQSARVTKVFQLEYSRASVVAETVKEALRDLLSGNDKTFQEPDRDGQPRSPRRADESGSLLRDLADDDELMRNSVRATFKGKLSIGVDNTTNTLVVSTEGEKLMQIVGSMIEALDQAAIPTDVVRVIKLPTTANVGGVKQALESLLGEEAFAGRDGKRDAAVRNRNPQGAGQPAAPAGIDAR